MLAAMLEEFDFGDIYVRHAVDGRPEQADYTMHVHNRCEVYLFISGNVEYLVEGSRYPLDTGSLLIMRPSESHAARILGSSRYERYAANFPAAYLAGIDPDALLLRPFLERPLGKGNLFTGRDMDMKLAEQLFAEMAAPAAPRERNIVLHTHIGMLLYMIAGAFSARGKTAPAAPTFPERAVSYINRHLFEELSVRNLAGHFNLSTSQFSRLFRKGVGSSPWEYILRKRLVAARELLGDGATAQDACERSGFSDYSSFYRAYRTYFHESPGETKGSSGSGH